MKRRGGEEREGGRKREGKEEGRERRRVVRKAKEYFTEGREEISE